MVVCPRYYSKRTMLYSFIYRGNGVNFWVTGHFFEVLGYTRVF